MNGRQDRNHLVYAPPRTQKIGPVTIALLVLNRTIGSGIFLSPRRVLLGTGSVGVSLIFWAVGGLLRTCGLLVWLEFGLSIPCENVAGRMRAFPRSGGEKNYLEHVLRNPPFLATCMYGVVFLILGNLAGNALAFGRFSMRASGIDDLDQNKSAVIGLALAALTASCLLNICSRKGGIVVNNIFAIFKISFLLIIIILGFMYRAGFRIPTSDRLNLISSQYPPSDPIQRELNHTSSFDTDKSFLGARHWMSDYVSSMLFILYAYSGSEQPFYVLSEVRNPRKTFPKATLFSMAATITLFLLVNVAYFCVVPKDLPLRDDSDIPLLFFDLIFGQGGSGAASRTMSAALAVSIFGNIVVMTFTASRVKQEIAKEAIIPWSFFFASGRSTPYAWLKSKWQARQQMRHSKTLQRIIEPEEEPWEETPMAALFLHWLSSIILVAVTCSLDPSDAWGVLVYLYSYVLRIMIGFLVSAGLLYLKLGSKVKWIGRQWVPRFKPWGGPTAAIIYCVACGFLLITPFLPLADDSPFFSTKIPSFVLPAIGLSSPLWGLLWFAGLHFIMWRRGQRLVIFREPHYERDEEDGEWVMKYETVDHVWRANVREDPRDVEEIPFE